MSTKTITKSLMSRGERGASMSISLLLFLVCALVASIVLAAATTSAGRMSGLAKDDQIYYSLTSAAQLVSDELNNDGAGQPITVEARYTHIEGQDKIPTPASSIVVRVLRDGVIESETKRSVIEQATLKLLLDEATMNERWQLAAGANADDPDPTAFWQDTTREISDSVASITISGNKIRSVDAQVRFNGSSNLLFDFVDGESNSDTNTISKLELSCYPDIIDMSFDSERGATTTEGRIITDIHTCTVVWRPMNIQWIAYGGGA